MATTEDRMIEDWLVVDGIATSPMGGHYGRCLQYLRRRVEALEARAATEESSATDVDSALLRTGMVTARHLATIKESSATEPAPAPAADRPLWKQMHLAYYEAVGVTESWASVLDVVADWLDARGYGWDAVAALHAEAQRAREGSKP